MIQYLVPALIVVAVVYLLARTKRGDDEAAGATSGSSDTGTFVLILVVGATVAVLSFFVMQALVE